MKDKQYPKDRDHCHYIGEYRGAAHRIRNLKYCVPKKIPIAFHNGSNYNYHLIKKEWVVFLFRRKYWKINNLYSYNREVSYKNW